MSENTCWLVGIVLVVVTLCSFGTYSGIKEDETILEMVKAGADPMKASCAVKGSTELNKQICHSL